MRELAVCAMVVALAACGMKSEPAPPLDLDCGYAGVPGDTLRFHLDERAGRFAVSGAGLPTLEDAAKFTADEARMTRQIPGGGEMGWVINRRDLSWGDARGLQFGKCRIVGSDKSSF